MGEAKYNGGSHNYYFACTVAAIPNAKQRQPFSFANLNVIIWLPWSMLMFDCVCLVLG
jgi:hypothetical protein